MRTIKFKGQKPSNGAWVYGCLVYSNEIEAAIYFQTGNGLIKVMDWVFVIPETVGQFTGLYDCDGNEIYEGDIVEWEKDGLMYVVRFWCGMFFASVQECNEGILGGFPLHALTEYEYRKCKIVGNIYDNPEYLKGDKK